MQKGVLEHSILGIRNCKYAHLLLTQGLSWSVLLMVCKEYGDPINNRYSWHGCTAIIQMLRLEAVSTPQQPQSKDRNLGTFLRYAGPYV